MNKKVLTLCAGFLLAGSMVAFAQQNALDKAVWPVGSPYVAPYAVKMANGAKPIAALEKVNEGAEGKYFQFIVGNAGKEAQANNVKKGNKGKLALTMAWNSTTKTYELALEDLTKTDAGRVRLERTLWEVRARKYSNSPVVYYTLINKASQLPLQVAFADQTGSATDGVDIINGSTDWMWSDGATASVKSSIDTNENVLQGIIRAASADAQSIIYLVKESSNAVSIKSQNATAAAPANAITFEAWEANPIVLTAAELNTELGYEQIRTQVKPDPKKSTFKFTFDPNVEGLDAINVMTSNTFIAEDAKAEASRFAGDAMPGYVRFRVADNSKRYLLVDTAYHDATVNGKYDLQMAVKTIEAPKYALVADGNTTGFTDAAGSYNNLTYSAAAVAQLKRQSNFKPVFYPATQTLRLQAEMIFKADKSKLVAGASYSPWWKQMYDNINSTTGVMTIANKKVAGHTFADGNNAAGASIAKNAATENDVYAYSNVGYYIPYQEELKNGGTYYQLLAWKGSTGNHPLWNAKAIPGTMRWSYDQWYAGTASTENFFAALSINNVVKLTTLTNAPKHVVLTTDVRDKWDANEAGGAATGKYNGLLTNISLADLLPIYTEVASIDPGFYYMQNANKVNTDLLKEGEYRYEDLAATAATYAYWDAIGEEYKVGDANRTSVAQGENGDARVAAAGNVVYSDDLKAIPSAQWYISGNGGYYTITNRESRRDWSTSYWWKTPEAGVYVNHNAYTNGTGYDGGLGENHRDTVRLIKVEDKVLKDIHAGYLNLTQAEAQEDTCLYNFKFITAATDENLFLDAAEDGGVLSILKEAKGNYKLERVLDRTEKMVDKYNGEAHFTDALVYGLNPSGNDAYQLNRAMYYIYKDEVSSNSTEGSGIRTRSYITLDGGRYRLNTVKVKVDGNGYTTYDAELNNGKADPRRNFYVKQISTENPNQYVLIDPTTVGREVNVNGEAALGVRVFVNQLTGEAQPAGLKSDAASNVYDNSVFSLDAAKALNYRDIRTEGVARDTLTFFKESNPSILLYEDKQVKGASVGLLNRVNDAQQQKNYSLFVDTADLSNEAKPIFLLALRPQSFGENGSNITDHNKEWYVDADYLVNMIDTAKLIAPKKYNPYKYTNIDKNVEKDFYRLGFVAARHEGNTLTIKNDNKKIALDKGMTKASFAFRYADTDREKFYIETMYNDKETGWVKILNEVPVVTNEIQEAEVYNVKKATELPTANDEVVATEVSVVASNGAVIIKNAAGKKVAISNILGKSIANTVIASDNETIAVPAGIVVVAVEGEEAIKAVVK